MPTFPCHHKACPSRPCRWRCEILSEMTFCHVNCVQNCVFRLPSLPPTSATPEKVSETSIFEAPIVFPFEKQQKLAVRSLFRLPRPSAGFLGLARTKSACVVEKERASWEKSAPRAKSDTCRPLLGSAQPRLSPRPQVPLQVWPTTTLTLLATPLMSFSAHSPLVALGLGRAPQGWAGWRCRMKKRFAATRNAAVGGASTPLAVRRSFATGQLLQNGQLRWVEGSLGCMLMLFEHGSQLRTSPQSCPKQGILCCHQTQSHGLACMPAQHKRGNHLMF